MKKRLILASLLCIGALVACSGKNNDPTSQVPTSEAPATSEVAPSTSEQAPTSEEVSSEEQSSEEVTSNETTSEEEVSQTIEYVIADKTLPDGLTYLTNNPEYPNAGWYSDGGLKMNFVNQGLLTAKFSSASTVTVILNVKALNENTKEGTDAKAFTVEGLNASGDVVATAALETVSVGENLVTLSGSGIVQVKVVMTDYPHNGNKFCNVNLGGLTVVTREYNGTPSTSEQAPTTSETPATSETPVTSETPATSEEVSSELTSNAPTSAPESSEEVTSETPSEEPSSETPATSEEVSSEVTSESTSEEESDETSSSTSTLVAVETLELSFADLANNASADSYLNTNFPDWTIGGKLGNGYAGYLGFGRSGDRQSSIKSPLFNATGEFNLTAVLKGNGSNQVATSTITFEVLDKDGNVIATGGTVTPADAVDTKYDIEFTYNSGKSYLDASYIRLSFNKDTGNIGLKSLEVSLVNGDNDDSGEVNPNPGTSETPVTSETPSTSEEVSSEVTSNPSTSEDVEIVVNNIADLIEVINNSGSGDKVYTKEQYTITGVITAAPNNETYNSQYSNYTFTITDETGSLEFYRGKTDLIDTIVIGDTVTVTGYGANYYGTYEFTAYNNVTPMIIAVEHNETTIEATIENGSITNVDGSAFTQTTAMTGDTISFKVEVEEGYKITSVKHNDISLTDNGGIYTFDAVTTNEIVVTIVSESAPTPTKIDGIGADFTAKTASNSNYTNTWDYGTWSLTGAANYNGGWAYMKFGGKSSNLTTCPVPSASTKEAVSQSVCQVVLNMNSGTVPSDTMTASLKLIVASDANFTNIVDTVDVGSVTAKTAKEYIFQPTSGTSWDANLYYKIEFVVTNTSSTNGIVWVDSIEFYTLDN